MRGPRRILLGAAALLFIVQAVASLSAADNAALDVVRDVIPFVIPLLTAVGAFIAARTRWQEDGAFWLFLGLGSLAWALGDIGFSIYGLMDYDPSGRLTLADAGYLALIPLWGAALILHPSRSRRGVDRLGTTIDALVVLALTATLTTAYVLVPALREATDVGGAIVNVAYPLGDLALIAVLVSILGKRAERMQRGDLFVTLAAAVFAIGDIVYARLSLLDAYDVGNPVDLAWSAAFVFVAIAAGHALAPHSQDEDRPSAVPVLAILGIVGICGLSVLAVTTRLRDTALLYGAVITGLFVMARLAILLIDRACLIRTLDQKVIELQDAHAARDRFIATVSHDLRSPLASVAGFAQLLQEPDFNGDPVRVAEFASSIERNARHLAHMTEDLLCAGQFASGHPPHLDLAPVGLREIAAQVLNDTSRADAVAIGGDGDIRAIADPQRLQQILTNLIDNAFKHSGSTDVRVHVGVEDENPFIEVSDAGVGICPERVRTIFDPFVSGMAHRSSVGLGLFVVSRLVGAMDGRLSVTSELGHGTTFKVVLPSARPTAVTGGTTVAAI